MLGEQAGLNAVDAAHVSDITYAGSGVTYGDPGLIVDPVSAVTMDGIAGKITGYNLVNTPAVQSVVAWYKGTQLLEQAIWSRRWNSNNGQAIWGQNNGGKIFGFMTGDAVGLYAGTTNVRDGVRHMLTWVLNGANLKMYVDGLGAPEVDATLDAGWTGATGASGTAPFTISFDAVTAGRFVTGTLGPIAFWNGVALSAADVQALWNAGTVAGAPPSGGFQ
jgi:hypothetical protein